MEDQFVKVCTGFTDSYTYVWSMSSGFEELKAICSKSAMCWQTHQACCLTLNTDIKVSIVIKVFTHRTKLRGREKGQPKYDLCR